MSMGADLLARFTSSLADFGEVLTVKTPPTTSGGAWGSYKDTFIPRNLPGAPGTFDYAAGENIDNPNMYEFTCAGTGSIAVGHVVQFGGQEYIVSDVNPKRLGGVTVGITASATRNSNALTS